MLNWAENLKVKVKSSSQTIYYELITFLGQSTVAVIYTREFYLSNFLKTSYIYWET